METNTKGLHPLLTVAAVSLTVFSAVGVAAITGLLPHSKGSAKEESAVAVLEAPAPKVAPAPVIEPAPAPKPKPVKKVVAKPAQPAAYNDFPATVAQAPAAVIAPPPATAVETPKPEVKPGLVGTVESVREIEEKGDAKGVGAVGGGALGAVLGHNIGNNNKLVTILGAAGGAVVGHQIEKKARATKVWEMTVRYDDGTSQVFKSEQQPFWQQGNRVRYHDGKLQPV
ncbi:MAG TPA: glycine zipper 2TM domain-containing protein [Burkholderiales bacterium]|nr:glycine zipper 2TM domain-containing protein [Burkholderiales bacterium]